MDIRTLSALGYRELYLSKKMLTPLLILFTTVSLLSVLIILSFDYGNMVNFLIDSAIISKHSPDGMPISDAEIENQILSVKENIVLISKFYPILLSGFTIADFLQSCQYDEKKKWKYFYSSTPVTPVTKAAVTYSVVILLNIVCFLVSTAFCGLMAAVSGIALSTADFGIILAGIAFGDLVGVIIQTGIKLFHSRDKAGILVVCIMLAGLLAFEAKQGLFDKSKQQNPISDIFSIEKINGICEKIIIPASVIIVVSVAAGFIVNVILYKRREK